jgi:hypothetical protein
MTVQQLTTANQSLAKITTTLGFKLQWLKQHRSTDPLQQMQTDAILDLADAVKQIQDALYPLPGLLIPDVSAARAAAGNTTTTLGTIRAVRRP